MSLPWSADSSVHDLWSGLDSQSTNGEARAYLREHLQRAFDAGRSNSAELVNAELVAALDRIANCEPRADRRHAGMVDVSEVQALQRIARTALARAKGEPS
jgi:hypothetical protein